MAPNKDRTPKSPSYGIGLARSIFWIVLALVGFPLAATLLGISEQQISIIIISLTYVAAIFWTVVFCFWIFNVNMTGKIMGAKLKFAPTSCWILNVLPFVNLVFSYFIFRQTYQVSADPVNWRSVKTKGIFSLWVFYVISALLQSAINRHEIYNLAVGNSNDEPLWIVMNLAAVALSLVASRKFAIYIKKITNNMSVAVEKFKHEMLKELTP